MAKTHTLDNQKIRFVALHRNNSSTQEMTPTNILNILDNFHQAIERLSMQNTEENSEFESLIEELHSYKKEYYALWTKFEKHERQSQLTQSRTKCTDNFDDMGNGEKDSLYIAQVQSRMTENSLLGTISAINVELDKQRVRVTNQEHELKRLKTVINKDSHLKKTMSEKIKDLEQRLQEESKASKNELKLQKQRTTDLNTLNQGLERQVALCKKNNHNQALIVKEASEWKTQFKRTVQQLESEKNELDGLLKMKECAIQTANAKCGNLKSQVKELELLVTTTQQLVKAQAQELTLARNRIDELQLSIKVTRQEAENHTKVIENLQASEANAQSSHEITMRELKASRKRNEELQSAINEIQYSKSEQAQELDNIRKENLRLLNHRNQEYQELCEKYANLESTVEIIKVTSMETLKNEKELETWKRRQLTTENFCDNEDWEIFLKQNERILASSHAAVQVKNHELHAKDQELQCRVSELNTYKTALIDMEICAGRTLNSLRNHNQELLSLVAVQDAKIHQVETLKDQMKEMALELESLQTEKANTERSFVHKCQEVDNLRIEFRSSVQLIKEKAHAELEEKNSELSILSKGKQDVCLLVEEKDRTLKNLRDTDNEREKELGRLRKEQGELETALHVARQELGKSQCPTCKDAKVKVQVNEYFSKKSNQKYRAMTHAQTQTCTVDGRNDPEAQGNDSRTTEQSIDSLCTTLNRQLSLASEKKEKRVGPPTVHHLMTDIQLICPLLHESSAHPVHQNNDKRATATIILPVEVRALRNSELQNYADLIQQEERSIKPHANTLISEKLRKVLGANSILKHMQVQSNFPLILPQKSIREEPELADSRKAFEVLELVEVPFLLICQVTAGYSFDQEPARELEASNVVNTGLVLDANIPQTIEEARRSQDQIFQISQEKLFITEKSLKKMLKDCRYFETDQDKTNMSNTEKAAELMIELAQNPALTIQSKSLQEQCDSQVRAFRTTQQKFKDLQVTIQGHDRELVELLKINENERSRELQTFEAKEAADRAMTTDLRKQIQTLETKHRSQGKSFQLVKEQLLRTNKNLKIMTADYYDMKMLVAEENTQLKNEQARTSHLTIQLKGCREQCSSQKYALDTAEQRLESLQKTLNARCQELESLKGNMTTHADILSQKNAQLLDAQEQSADLTTRLKALQERTDLQHCRLEETLQELENLRMNNQDLLRELESLKDEHIDAKNIAKGTGQLMNIQDQTNKERKYTMARVEVEALRSELNNLRIYQEQRASQTQEHHKLHRNNLEKVVQDNKSREVRKTADEQNLVSALASNTLKNQVLQSKTQSQGKSLPCKVLQKTHYTMAPRLDTPSWGGLKKSFSDADVGTEVTTRHRYALGFRKKEGDNGESRFFKNQRASIYTFNESNDNLEQ
ncbi:hypothetical protein GG344DRAFT_76314 [Lentinula edodes]|nr:hypothetical protein GG344DRAFT_76314 [Lentinula edodes]